MACSARHAFAKAAPEAGPRAPIPSTKQTPRSLPPSLPTTTATRPAAPPSLPPSLPPPPPAPGPPVLGSLSTVATGTISSRNLPAACAAAASAWERAANASCTSRDTPYCAATFSLVMPAGGGAAAGLKVGLVAQEEQGAGEASGLGDGVGGGGGGVWKPAARGKDGAGDAGMGATAAGLRGRALANHTTPGAPLLMCCEPLCCGQRGCRHGVGGCGGCGGGGGRRTHGQQAVLGALVLGHPRVDGALPGHGVGCHGLHPTGDADLIVAGLDGRSHLRNGLQACWAGSGRAGGAGRGARRQAGAGLGGQAGGEAAGGWRLRGNRLVPNPCTVLRCHVRMPTRPCAAPEEH